jgi:acetyl-CoA acetyltransferase
MLILDTMWSGAGGPPNPNLLARDAYIDMMRTAQNVADKYELTRKEIDAFALRSHQHAAAARDSGRLAKEIHPVEISGTHKQPGRRFEHDESVRDDLERLARAVASATHALDPRIMGIAPAYAIPKALRRAGLSPEQIDLWEIHEAYAAVAVAILRELPNQLDGFRVPTRSSTPTAERSRSVTRLDPRAAGMC